MSGRPRDAEPRPPTDADTETVTATVTEADTLRRHPSLDDRLDPAIRIVDPDPAWPALADEELRRIAAVLGPVAVRLEHVGSTAVPGLAAKPILDLQLSVDAIARRQSYVGPLERLGYLFVPDPDAPEYHFFARPPGRPRTHHLHVCQAAGHEELRHIAVRDFLRAHPQDAATYAALKRQIAADHPNDRIAYIEGKNDHMKRLQERALTWASTGGAAVRREEPGRDRRQAQERPS